MKTTFLTIILSLALVSVFSQDVTTVEAKSTDISDNLDLDAVASIFGESETLEDFERKLNDPKLQISNLDLNGDGEVDYLRVVETSKETTHLIAIQAVIGEGKYQDIATIEVEKDKSGESTVQVVGDVYMYGPDYIIQPVYIQRPVVVTYFYGPYYSPWYSPYYYGYYPPYYDPWSPYPPYVYRSNVYVHVNINNSYQRTSHRSSARAATMQQQVKRNDYAKTHPDRSFQNRNEGVRNTQELENRRDVNKPRTPNSGPQAKPTTRPVSNNWKPSSERENNGKPVDRPNSQPSSKQGYKNRDIQTGKPSQSPVRNNPSQNAKPQTYDQVTRPSDNQNARPSSQSGVKPATNQQNAKPSTTQQNAKPSTNQQNAKPSTSQQKANPGSQNAVKQSVPVNKPTQKTKTTATQSKSSTSDPKGGKR